MAKWTLEKEIQLQSLLAEKESNFSTQKTELLQLLERIFPGRHFDYDSVEMLFGNANKVVNCLTPFLR